MHQFSNSENMPLSRQLHYLYSTPKTLMPKTRLVIRRNQHVHRHEHKHEPPLAKPENNIAKRSAHANKSTAPRRAWFPPTSVRWKRLKFGAIGRHDTARTNARSHGGQNGPENAKQVCNINNTETWRGVSKAKACVSGRRETASKFAHVNANANARMCRMVYFVLAWV